MPELGSFDWSAVWQVLPDVLRAGIVAAVAAMVALGVRRALW